MTQPVPAWSDLIGKPFRFGGRGPEDFDCYGLVVEMNRRAGIVLPNYVSPRDDFEIGLLIGEQLHRWEPCKCGPGASVALRIGRYVSHVGYMVSDFEMLHAWNHTGGVTKEPLDATWERRIAGFYRFKQ